MFRQSAIIDEVNAAMDRQKQEQRGFYEQQISLSYLSFGDHGCFAVAQQIRMLTRVTALDLRGNKIAAPGLTTLAEGLRAAISLRSVCLKYNQIVYPNENGLNALADALSDPTGPPMQRLDLRNNELASHGECLANMVQSAQSLTHAQLSFNNLTIDDVVHLRKAVENNEQLLEIDVEGHACGEVDEEEVIMGKAQDWVGMLHDALHENRKRRELAAEKPPPEVEHQEVTMQSFSEDAAEFGAHEWVEQAKIWLAWLQQEERIVEKQRVRDQKLIRDLTTKIKREELKEQEAREKAALKAEMEAARQAEDPDGLLEIEPDSPVKVKKRKKRGPTLAEQLAAVVERSTFCDEHIRLARAFQPTINAGMKLVNSLMKKQDQVGKELLAVRRRLTGLINRMDQLKMVLSAENRELTDGLSAMETQLSKMTDEEKRLERELQEAQAARAEIIKEHTYQHNNVWAVRTGRMHTTIRQLMERKGELAAKLTEEGKRLLLETERYEGLRVQYVKIRDHMDSLMGNPNRMLEDYEAALDESEEDSDGVEYEDPEPQ